MAGWWGGLRRPRQGPLLGWWASTLCIESWVGGRLPPLRMPALVRGTGPPPVRTSAQAEAVAGVAPVQPTPAPVPIEGLWVCCVIAAAGEGVGVLVPCAQLHSWHGGRGGGEGRGIWRPQL